MMNSAVSKLRSRIKSKFPRFVFWARHVREVLGMFFPPIVIIESTLFCKSITGGGSFKPDLKYNFRVFDSIEVLMPYAADPFWGNKLIHKGSIKSFNEKLLCFALLDGDRLLAVRWCVCCKVKSRIRPFPGNFDFGSAPYVHGLLVHPDFRRKGLATEINGHIVDYLRKRGIVRELALVLRKNTPAQKLNKNTNHKECAYVTTLRILGFEHVKYTPVVKDNNLNKSNFIGE